MKLTYRGISYEHDLPVVETVEGKVGGKFHGLDWRFHNLKKPPVLQPSVNLTYRGVTYNNRPVTTSESTGQNIQQKARWLMLSRAKITKNRTESMLRRSAHEVGLV